MRLVIPDLISNSYFPAMAAAELGLFQDEGLAVDHVELLFPVTRAMELLRKGEVDFVVGAAHAALQAFPNWRGARLLAAAAQRMYWFLVVRTDLAVRRNELEKLRGLRIGAAPGPDLGLLRLLRAAGLDPGRDVAIGPVPGTSAAGTSFGITAAQALEEGHIDAFWANGMGAEVAVRRGSGTVVLDVRRGDGPSGCQDYTFAALVARDELVQRHPELARAAVRGLRRAQHALRADPSLAAGIGRKLFPAMEAELIEELVRRDIAYYDSAISPATFDALNSFARDMGLLTKDISYAEVVAGDT